MTTLTQTTPTARPAFSPKLLAGGFVAGMVMGMWQMVLEAILPNGGGFWSPLVYIAATIFRGFQTVTAPVPFDLLGVIAGLMGHMMNSIIFGLIFAGFIAPRTRTLMGKVIAGIVYGVIIYAVMWLAVVPIFDPVMLRLNAPVFFLGHMMFGAALGLVSHWMAEKA
ncbi:MAG: hypothetical protein HYR71_13600 [Chloroflexi bacterium]|nr:hypothetical protein [Chloroflexota bacterium]